MRRRRTRRYDKWSHYGIPREQIENMPRYKRLVELGYPPSIARADTRACLKHHPKLAFK